MKRVRLAPHVVEAFKQQDADAAMPSAGYERGSLWSADKPRVRGQVYDNALLDLAYKFSLMGASVPMLCELLECSNHTFHQWMKEVPGFNDAIQSGRALADANVTRSLYRRATGYSQSKIKIFYNATLDKVIEVPYTEWVMGDVGAAQFWLANRQQDLWKSRNELNGGSTGVPTQAPPTIVFNIVSNDPEQVTIEG
jgi:hypothetical protein